MTINKAVIPAAGLGKRMRPVTHSIPKEMMPINGKPFIHYVVDEAIEAGIKDILIITRSGKEAIQEYFETIGYTNIFYKPQKEQKGLGHAILEAKSFINNEPFAVLLGDDYFISDVPAVKQLIDSYSKNKLLNSTVIGVEKKSPKEMTSKGMVEVSDDVKLMQVTGLVEKPTIDKVTSDLAVSGRYILPSEIFSHLETTKPGYNNEVQLTDAMASFLRNHPNNTYATIIEGSRSDIGDPLNYLKAQIDFFKSDKDKRIMIKEYINGGTNG